MCVFLLTHLMRVIQVINIVYHIKVAHFYFNYEIFGKFRIDILIVTIDQTNQFSLEFIIKFKRVYVPQKTPIKRASAKK